MQQLNLLFAPHRESPWEEYARMRGRGWSRRRRVVLTQPPRTWSEALCALFAVQHAARGGGELRRPIVEYLDEANGESRGAVLRLARLLTCSYCDKTHEGGDGDHVVPEGDRGADNYTPCERTCNSSKGVRDLFAFLLDPRNAHRAKFFFSSAHWPDVVVVYCRQKWMVLKASAQLDERATNFVCAAVERFSRLPMPLRHDETA